MTYAINLFSYSTSCRLGECQAIKLNKIDFINQTVLVDSAQDNRCRITNDKTKTGIIRIIPLTEKCMRIIKELSIGRKPDDYLFSLDGIKTLDPKVIQKGLYKAFEKIGISSQDLMSTIENKPYQFTFMY